MRVEKLGRGDVERVRGMEHLLDAPARADATRLFLARDGHHLLVAYVDDAPVGFISGVEMTHPDKGTEMFVYELGVDEDHRRRGVARELLEALKGVARTRGCYGMWVLAEADNVAALGAYRRSDAFVQGSQLMLAWSL